MGLLIFDLDQRDNWQLCFCARLLVTLITFAGKISPTVSDSLLSSSGVGSGPSSSNVYLPVNFKMSNAQLAFFLREAQITGQTNVGANGKTSTSTGAGNPSSGNPLQRSESFVVFQTKDLPAINVSFGPFARDQALSKELLQPTSPLDIPGQLTVNWKVRAFIVQARVFSNNPTIQVFFYIAGRDWDDFRAQDRLPCVRLHAFRDVREIKTSCRMKGNLAQCLAQLDLPLSWFNTNVAPLGRRKGSGDGLLDGLTPETLQAELYYTLHGPNGEGECMEGSGTQRGGSGGYSRGEPPSQHPLLRIGSISLYQASQEQLLVDKQLDKNLFLRLPEKPLKPGETLRIFLYLMPNSTIDQFTLKVKAKKGVNLLQTNSKSPQWKVEWEVQSGAKHSITTVEGTKVKGGRDGDALGSVEVMALDFSMENFTSLSVTRRINWNIDYKSPQQQRNPQTESEKVVTELTVVQRDIQAILPLAMDTEIINTAILTGRTVAIPVKMVSIEMNGAVTDVSAFVQCKSANEDIVKVSMNCDYVFVNGKETRGSMNARVMFSYEHLSAPLELTVWTPKLPLVVELSDYTLSFIKGWRVPILPDRRSTRDSEVEDEDPVVARGCTLQFQRSQVKVLTQFITTSTEGTDQLITLLGPDWLLDVTDLVQDSLKVADPRIGELVDRTILVGLELGSTVLKVESPLAVDASLGESPFSVTDDKVSITELKASAVAGLSLSVQPSPGNSHTMVAKATGTHTLTAPKQEASLSVWLLFSDGTSASLTSFDPKDFVLNASSSHPGVLSVGQDAQRWPLLVAEGDPSTSPSSSSPSSFSPTPVSARLEMTICETCQKTKRKSVIASANVQVRVRFGKEEDDSEEEDEEEEEEDGTVTTDGEIQLRSVTRRPKMVDSKAKNGRVTYTDTSNNEQPASVPIDYTNFPTVSNQAPTETDESENEEDEDDDDFVHSPRNMTDLEIGMYALLGVFCLAILVFLINCIVFVLKYRHKRIPPEGQANMDHSHHWVFLGNGEPLRAQCSDLSPHQQQQIMIAESPINPLDGCGVGGGGVGGMMMQGGVVGVGSSSSSHSQQGGGGCCHADHHSSGSSQTSVQSQVHGRGDGSSGGGSSTKENNIGGGGEEASSPTSKRKRVKFTTFSSSALPADELPYNSIPVADEEDIQWVCQDMGFQDPEELHDYMRRIKEIA